MRKYYSEIDQKNLFKTQISFKSMFEYKTTLVLRFLLDVLTFKVLKQIKTWLKFAHTSVWEQSRNSFSLDPRFTSALHEIEESEWFRPVKTVLLSVLTR